MLNIKEKITQPFTADTIRGINKVTSTASSVSNSITSTNNTASCVPDIHSTPDATDTVMPQFRFPIYKGMKKEIFENGNISSITAGFGWNIKDSRCDVDVSAFLLKNEKVISDDWFVFYGQPSSPDGSVKYITRRSDDRKAFIVDFSRINPDVQKIVFVITIDEATEKGLNFGMLSDAYIRIICNNSEVVSFCLSDYYDNITSMMMGEIYLYNGKWKFNAVGNGIAEDLAGLCRFYGVNIE